MEQTVGELIEMLSKFDRNARIAKGHEFDVKWDGQRCRLVNDSLQRQIEEGIESVNLNDE